MINYTYRYRDGTFADNIIEFITFCGCQLFAVVQIQYPLILRKYYGSGYYRSGKRSASDLVDTTYRPSISILLLV